MPDLKTLLAEREKLTVELSEMTGRRRVARGKLTRLRNGANPKTLALADQPIGTRRSEISPQVADQVARIRRAARALGRLDADMSNTERARNRLADRINLVRGDPVASVDTLTAGLRRDVPMVLLPVRIETRFAEGVADDRLVLLLRIFPSAPHVQTRLDSLDDDEQALHDAYAAVLANGDQDAATQARRILRTATSPERAAWIARHAEDRTPNTPSAPPDALSWATMMPRRWVVRLRSDGRTLMEHVSGEVSAEAAVLASGARRAEDGLFAEWLSDFDKAVDFGMALRLPLDAKTSAHARKTGLDVIVTGIDHTGDPDVGADDLAQALEGHAFGNGLGLVPNGKPTNAPQDPARATTADDNFEDLYAPPSLTEAPKCDAAQLAQALGSAPDRLAYIARGASSGQNGKFLSGTADASAMATLLWPVVQGYAGKEISRIEAPYGHFTRHVAAVLPVLRVDDMPLGFLVCGHDNDVPENDLGRRILGQSPFADPEPWRRALLKTPSVPHGVADPEGFVEMTSMTGVSQSFRMRRVKVSQTRSNLPQGLVSAAAAPFFSKFSWLPAMTANTNAYEWSAGLVRGNAEDAVSGALYLAALADAMETVLGGGAAQLPAPTVTSPALLYRLARHSAIFVARWAELIGVDLPDRSPFLEAVAAAQNVQPGQIAMANVKDVFDHLGQAIGVLQPANSSRGAGLTIAADAAEDPSVSDRLLAPQTGRVSRGNPQPQATRSPVLPDRDVPAAVLDAVLAPLPTTPPDPVPVPVDSHDISPADRVTEHIAAARQLAQADDAELERLMAETLDLAAYRRDAWVSSVHHRHLTLMRARRPHGAHIGAYGFVLGLKPERVPVPRRGPGHHINDPATAGGFLAAHTPNQAATLAVVRNAYLTHANDAATADTLRLKLDSRQVRQAMSLVDALRAGSTLDVLFGTRFEKYLHLRNQARIQANPALPGLDRRLIAFRRVFAQSKTKDAGTLGQIVDGYALILAWRDLASGTGTPRAGLLNGILTAEPLDTDDLEAVLNDLEGLIDAVNDLMLFEATYHAVRGDPAAATAALDAHSGLAAPPPLRRHSTISESEAFVPASV